MKQKYNIKQLVTVLVKGRHKLGLSQSELAQKAGLGQAHVSRIESGSVNIRVTSLVEIARALGFELMLIPKEYVTTVKALTTFTNNETTDEAAYKPDMGEDS